jgi:hypothetical protein
VLLQLGQDAVAPSGIEVSLEEALKLGMQFILSLRLALAEAELAGIPVANGMVV